MSTQGMMARTRIWLSLLAALILLAGCTILREPSHRPLTHHLPPASSGVLSQVSDQFQDIYGPDTSGFQLLENNQEAMSWRLALVDHAQASIDAQYFIWQNDAAGNLLFSRLLQAADRGVRVRLLVDDIFLASRDSTIAMISRHPNFKIRIYNPGRIRNSRLGGLGEFLLYFRELNRRMHNKLFVVDNRLAIVGGRNIGNQYFGLGEEYNFIDLDVLVAGGVVQEISEAFDQYWNAEPAYPGTAMGSGGSAKQEARFRARLQESLLDNGALRGAYPLYQRDWSKAILELPGSMKSGRAHFIQDEPVSFGREEVRLLDMLDYLAEPNHDELIIISPYLIPKKEARENLAQLTSEGVAVKILTGSLGANNHTAAHSHYKKYRHQILKAGACLFELRHDPSESLRRLAEATTPSKFLCLHVKAIVGDRTRCFIGSLNFDPRAMDINTENGLLINSKPLAEELAGHLDNMMGPENAWRVFLNDEGALRWHSAGETVSRQPARSFGQRIADFFFRLLPIEGQI